MSDAAIVFRRPVEADHAAVIARMDGWWPGRRARTFVQRWWFRHATGTSWVAEGEDGRLVGFVLAQPSGDDPAVALVHAIAVNPRFRRIVRSAYFKSAMTVSIGNVDQKR